MYSQLPNTAYNKSHFPKTNVRCNDALIDGNVVVNGFNISHATSVFVSSGSEIPKPAVISDRAATVAGVATFNYSALGLTGSLIPRVYASIDYGSAPTPAQASWCAVTSSSTTSCTVTVYYNIAGTTAVNPINGLIISALIVGQFP